MVIGVGLPSILTVIVPSAPDTVLPCISVNKMAMLLSVPASAFVSSKMLTWANLPKIKCTFTVALCSFSVAVISTGPAA